MRIEPKSAYESMRIYYIINIVKLIHVSVTFCDHLQGSVLRRMYYKDITPMYEYKTLSFKHVIQNMLKYKIQIILFVLDLRE